MEKILIGAVVVLIAACAIIMYLYRQNAALKKELVDVKSEPKKEQDDEYVEVEEEVEEEEVEDED